jgi:hypothetical protein
MASQMRLPAITHDLTALVDREEQGVSRLDSYLADCYALVQGQFGGYFEYLVSCLFAPSQ